MKLKLILEGKKHSCLTHCQACNFYGNNNHFENPKDKKVMVRWFSEKLVLCNSCKNQVERGYSIIAKKGGYGGRYLKKIKGVFEDE